MCIYNRLRGDVTTSLIPYTSHDVNIVSLSLYTDAVAIVADIFGICLGIFCICSCCSIVVLYKYCCNSPRRPAYQPTRHPRRAPRRTSSVNTTVVAARLPDSGQTYATPGCHDQQYSYNNDGSQFYSGVNPAPPDYHNSTSFPPIQRALPIPAPPMAPHISQV